MSSKFGITVSGDYIRFIDRHGTDLARLSIPWITREDREELREADRPARPALKLPDQARPTCIPRRSAHVEPHVQAMAIGVDVRLPDRDQPQLPDAPRARVRRVRRRRGRGDRLSRVRDPCCSTSSVTRWSPASSASGSAASSSASSVAPPRWSTCRARPTTSSRSPRPVRRCRSCSRALASASAR